MQMVNCSYQGHQDQPITNICVSRYCSQDRLQCQYCLDEKLHQSHQFSNEDNIHVKDLQIKLKSKRSMMNTDIVDLMLIQSKLKNLKVNIEAQISKVDQLLSEMIVVISKHLKNINIIKLVAMRQQSSYLLGSDKFQQSWKYKDNLLVQKENFEDNCKRLEMYLRHFKEMIQIEQDSFNLKNEKNLKKSIMELTYDYSYIQFEDYVTTAFQQINNLQIDPTGKSIICQFDKKIFRLYNLNESQGYYEFQLLPPFDTEEFKIKSFALDDKANNLLVELSRGNLLKYVFNSDRNFYFEMKIKLEKDEIKQLTIFQNMFITIHTAQRSLIILNLEDLQQRFKFQYQSTGRFQINQSLNLIWLPVLDSIQYIFFPDGQKQINISNIYKRNKFNQLNFSNFNDKVITYTKYENDAQIYKLNLNDQKKQMEILYSLNLKNESLCFNWAFQDNYIIKVQNNGYDCQRVVRKTNL